YGQDERVEDRPPPRPQSPIEQQSGGSEERERREAPNGVLEHLQARTPLACEDDPRQQDRRDDAERNVNELPGPDSRLELVVPRVRRQEAIRAYRPHGQRGGCPLQSAEPEGARQPREPGHVRSHRSE